MFKVYHLIFTTSKFKRGNKTKRVSRFAEFKSIHQPKSHFCTMVRWEKMMEYNEKPWVLVYVWILWPSANYSFCSHLGKKNAYACPSYFTKLRWRSLRYVLDMPFKIIHNILKPIMVFPIDYRQFVPCYPTQWIPKPSQISIWTLLLFLQLNLLDKNP